MSPLPLPLLLPRVAARMCVAAPGAARHVPQLTMARTSEPPHAVPLHHPGTPAPSRQDFGEYLSMMVKKMQDVTKESDIVGAFEPLDPRGTGFISQTQFRDILDGLGEEVTEEEALEFIVESDPEATGQVNYRIFVKSMLELAPG